MNNVAKYTIKNGLDIFVKIVRINDVKQVKDNTFTITTEENKVFDVNIPLIPRRIKGEICVLITDKKRVLSITPLTTKNNLNRIFFNFSKRTY